MAFTCLGFGETPMLADGATVPGRSTGGESSLSQSP